MNEVSSIKEYSERLSTEIGQSNVELAEKTSKISALVQGSRNGQDAVVALSVALRSLADAISSMRELNKTCESCIEKLTK